MSPQRAIPEELVAYLESGPSMLIGTRDKDLRPTAARATGVHVAADRLSLVAYLPRPTMGRTLANLRENGRVALGFSRPVDHKTLQLKGRCLEIREPTEDDLARQRAYLTGFVEHLRIVNVSPTRTSRLTLTPCVAVHIAVESIFEQTPGPAAGRRLEDGPA